MIVDNLGKERRRLGEYLPEVFETCLANFYITSCLFIRFIYVSYGKINKVFTFAHYQLIVDNRSKIKIISYKE